MTIRLTLLSILGALLAVVMTGPPANAGCDWVRVAQTVMGAVHMHFEYRCSGESQPGNTASVLAPRDSGWDAVCVRSAIAAGVAPASFCDLPPGVAVVPAVTPGLVARAFRNLPLPASALSVQPGDGRTLVNFETNFFTERGEFTRVVRLLGRRVELRIWPSRFVWCFGDGAELGSESAGSPYPDLAITHAYGRAGGVRPRVDTTYAARFRVDGGPWRDVAGTVTIPGASVPLRVVTASPVLVGYH